MRRLCVLVLPFSVPFLALVSAEDLACPNYPIAARTEQRARLELDRAASRWHKSADRSASIGLKRNNFIDDILFSTAPAIV